MDCFGRDFDGYHVAPWEENRCRLTDLEQQAIEAAKDTVEGTGYIYFDTCKTITNKQMRGVMSSLEKKGIIEATMEEPFEAYPCEAYEEWFPGLYS